MAKKTKPAAAEKEEAALVAGRYRPGTAIANTYELLADGQPHTWEEVEKAHLAAGAKYKRDSVWWLTKHGKETGLWEIARDADAVQLIPKDHKKPKAAAPKAATATSAQSTAPKKKKKSRRAVDATPEQVIRKGA